MCHTRDAVDWASSNIPHAIPWPQPVIVHVFLRQCSADVSQMFRHFKRHLAGADDASAIAFLRVLSLQLSFTRTILPCKLGRSHCGFAIVSTLGIPLRLRIYRVENECVRICLQKLLQDRLTGRANKYHPLFTLAFRLVAKWFVAPRCRVTLVYLAPRDVPDFLRPHAGDEFQLHHRPHHAPQIFANCIY